MVQSGVFAQDDLDSLLEVPADAAEDEASGSSDHSEGSDDSRRSERGVDETIPVESLRPREEPLARSVPRRNVLVEEIVVTAQKREESLQDVPISVQAFSGEKLDALGVNSAVDLPRITPGFVLTETIGYVTTYIRGLGSDAFAFADPSVAIYLDGIYNPSATTATQDFGPVERIEVLKGPQGTLFGRNAIGGAVNIISRPLSLDRPEATLSSSYLDYGGWRNSVSASVPLGDTLAIGLSGLYNKEEPFTDVTIDNVGLPSTVQRGARGRLRWAPVDVLELSLSASTVEASTVPANVVVNTNPSTLGRLLGIQAQDAYSGNVNEAVENARYEEQLYSAQGDLYLDWFDIKLLGSHQEVLSVQGLDFDGSDRPVAFLAVDPRISDIQTAELQILSNDGSWMPERLKWIIGGYYFKGKDGYKDSVLRVGETTLLGEAITILGIPLPEGLPEVFGLLASLPVPTGNLGFSGLLDTESTAGFVQATYDFTDWAALTLGGRYQVEERGIIESTGYLRLANGERSLIPGQDYSCATDPQWCDTTKAFSPKVTLDLKPWGDTLLYLSWQQATKASTFNVINIYDQPEFVPKEDVTAYEVGIKTSLFDSLMTFNAAAFRYDLENLQVQFVSLLTGGALSFEPAPRARVQGVEFDLLAQILPDHVDDLVVTVGATFMDAKYLEFPNASGFDPETGIYSGNLDHSGNQIVRSPDFTGSVTITKMFPFSFGAIELGVDYYHNSGYFFLAQNQPNDEQPGYGLLGARASLVVDQWGLRIGAFGQNLTGEEYFRTRLPADFGALDAPAPKAVYGVKLGWQLP
jgi:iron complex outermembrane recepter protein